MQEQLRSNQHALQSTHNNAFLLECHSPAASTPCMCTLHVNRCALHACGRWVALPPEQQGHFAASYQCMRPAKASKVLSLAVVVSLAIAVSLAMAVSWTSPFLC
eukprot:1156378-Pelagomonas_calceolata.AAC.2